MPANPRPAVAYIAPAGPCRDDLERFGFADAGAAIAFARAHLPAPYKLLADRRFFEVVERPDQGGRDDDRRRVAALQSALGDPSIRAIVAARGGAWLGRVVAELDFGPLLRRTSPLALLGFSEITSLVNWVAASRAGLGLYWLAPHYLGWKVTPRDAGLAALAEFWRLLPQMIGDAPAGGSHADSAQAGDERAGHERAGSGRGGETPAGRVRRTAVTDLATGLKIEKPEDSAAGAGPVAAAAQAPIRGRLVAGRARSGSIRIVGGCLSVFAATLPGPLARRLSPRGKWLLIEDINEAPYRIDRHLSTLKLMGWFERVAGVLVGDFHTGQESQQAAVVECLRYHLPRGGATPVVVTGDVGHVWPMTPVALNRPLALRVRGREVRIGGRL